MMHPPPSASSYDSETTLQSDLKLEIEDELHQAVYETTGLRSHPFDIAQLTSKVLSAPAIQAWKKAIRQPTFKSPSDTSRYWSRSKHERDHYAPLANFLNTICEEVASHSTPGNYHNSLVFSRYDKEMQDGVGKEHLLKPDLLGCNRLIDDNEQVSWNEPEGAAEVKNSWRKMVAQGGSYGRALLAARHSRRFSWVILLNHKTVEARVSFFHRSGLTTTHAFELNKPRGFDGFVSSIVDIVTPHDAFSAGMDPSRTDMRVALPVPNNANNLFKVTREICYHSVIRGRATEVVRLERLEEPHTRPAPEISELDEIPIFGKTTVESPTYEVPGLQNLPRILVMKDSWPLTSRCVNEGDMFRAAQGYFGLPDVRATFEVYYRTPGDHTFPASPNMKMWDIFGDTDGEGHQLEQRTHMRTITTTEGSPLRGAKGPKELLEAVLHAMIGYLNLFCKGWQHRDVSNSNILLVELALSAIGCPSDDQAHNFGLKHCRAILTDGDQAIKWKETREPATHRSGTLPFISYALLFTWNSPKKYFHTGLDDLESFIWVFIWEFLHHGAFWGLLSDDEATHLQQLQTTSPINLAAAKQSFLYAVRINELGNTPFFELLAKWVKIRETASETMRLKRLAADGATVELHSIRMSRVTGPKMSENIRTCHGSPKVFSNVSEKSQNSQKLPKIRIFHARGTFRSLEGQLGHFLAHLGTSGCWEG
ncbi:hypothetical protein B0H19DRAFT_1158202 [Mycena capillaripes]|nr:hypothetical protein B0H19DRAFT_1158202 [Mycena capillaripes]